MRNTISFMRHKIYFFCIFFFNIYRDSNDEQNIVQFNSFKYKNFIDSDNVRLNSFKVKTRLTLSSRMMHENIKCVDLMIGGKASVCIRLSNEQQRMYTSSNYSLFLSIFLSSLTHSLTHHKYFSHC